MQTCAQRKDFMCTRSCAHPPTHTHTHTHTQTQINNKQWSLGIYGVEEDAAAARDVVAKILGYALNFKTPWEIIGQRSVCADQRVADACRAATAFMLGKSITFGVLLIKQVNT